MLRQLWLIVTIVNIATIVIISRVSRQGHVVFATEHGLLCRCMSGRLVVAEWQPCMLANIHMEYGHWAVLGSPLVLCNTSHNRKLALETKKTKGKTQGKGNP